MGQFSARLGRLFFSLLLACTAVPAKAQVMHPGPAATCPICAAQRLRALRELRDAPVDTRLIYPDRIGNRIGIGRASRTPSGIVIQPPPASITIENWERYEALSNSNSDLWKSKFRDQLKIPDEPNRGGESQFFIDFPRTNVLPEAIGLHAVVVTDSLNDALQRRELLKTITTSPKSFSALIGYPTSAGGLKGVLNGDVNAGLPTWIQAERGFSALIAEHEISRLGPDASVGKLLMPNGTYLRRVEERAKEKERYIAQIALAENILFVTCHADRLVLRVPGLGEDAVEITPADIESLRLVRKPFVFLRVCETSPGDNTVFAKAFLKAGAIGVSANKGTITATEALEEVKQFMESLKQQETIEGTLRTMKRIMNALYVLDDHGNSVQPRA